MSLAAPQACDRAGWKAILDRFPARAAATARHGRLSWREAGPADGMPLILLHGIGSGSGSWAWQVDAFAAAGYRIVAWDAPGYGDSDRGPDPAPRPAAYADALADLLDALAVGTCDLVGHSLGSLIGASFAADRPERVRRLVLASTAHGHARLDPAARREKLDARLSAFDRLGPRAHAEERAPRLLSDRADADAVALVRYNMARLRAEGYAAAARLLSRGDLLADAARLCGPVLVLGGAADAVTPPAACRQTAAAIGPRAIYREIPGAGHACYIEAPEAFNAAVLAFLGEGE